MKKVGVVTIVSLIVAIIGVIAPVLWDHYKTRSSLELQLTSKTTIIDTKEGIDKLTVTYDKKKIPSITKYTFVLINSGRTPIVLKDVVDEPQITFQPANEILEARVGNLSPPELQTKSFVDTLKNKIVIKFPLLNPSDSMEINVFVSGSDPKFNALARIAGISQLQIIDKTKLTHNKFKSLTWYQSIIVLAVLFCFFMTTILLIHYGQRSEIKRLWENGNIKIPSNLDKTEYIEYLKNTFPPAITGAALSPIFNTLNLLSTDVVDHDQHKVVTNEISKILADNREPIFASISFGFIGVAGTIFIIYNFL